MSVSKLHKIIGIILAAPLLAWALTGIVFLIKPGYEEAYETLAPRMYPLEKTFTLNLRPGWQEAKLLRTVLGYHLLLNSETRWLHLDPETFDQRPPPSTQQIRRLVQDAIGSDDTRYGEIVDIDGGKILTSTGVEITLNWHTLSLHQSGADTRLIDTLYKVHYLQWWGQPSANVIFGALGIAALLVLTVLGLANARRRVF